MIRHETLNPPQHIYPVNPWKIIETSFYPRFLAQTETIFAIGNGYLGMRGTFDEGAPSAQNGTFINGFHETWPIIYGEDAYGFARTGQTMLNVTDAKNIRLYVDDEPFYLPTASLQLYQRTLDMQAGTLDREVLWETPSGKRVLIESRRMISLEHRHLAAISYQITLLNADAPVEISSEMKADQPNPEGVNDPRKARGFKNKVLHAREYFARDLRLVLSHQAENSRMTLACGVDHLFETDSPWTVKTEVGPDAARAVFSIDATSGKPINLVKFISYHTSSKEPTSELCDRTERTLDRACRHGFKALSQRQKEYLADFWDRSDIEIEEIPDGKRQCGEMQQALRWNLFQILQASARAEGVGIPAKGLTGQTYEGHYFWDTEIYLLPFLTYTAPSVSRNLLRFRHSMLDKARDRAGEVNQKGALFPWRTINGKEASAYYAAGTAQYHINADIAYALRKYVDITEDKSLLFDEGAEILVETARLWLDLGFYSARRGGAFCIHGVTGPDEYATVVNNNAFTNLMARENLRYAAETITEMRERYPEHYATLVHRTGLDFSEVNQWRLAGESMHVPFDETLGIHPQDDHFLDLKVWDIKGTPKDRFPLLLYHHPLVIYRHQVIKQADVVLAMFLLGSEFSADQKKRNFNYYDPLTTGDSSLSACIQSIIAAEVGDGENALKYARYALLMDLADVGGNVKDGCHIASMGGTWMTMVYGFAGMRDHAGELSFSPRLPATIRKISFPLTIAGQRLKVEMTSNSATYLLSRGNRMKIVHQGEAFQLLRNEPLVLPVNEKAAAGEGSKSGG